LIVPFPESSLNQEAGKLFMDDYQEYFGMARIYTQVHASKSKIQSKPNSNNTNNSKLNNNLTLNNNNYNINNPTIILIDEPNKSSKFFNGTLNNIDESFNNSNPLEINNNINNNLNANNNGFSLRNSQKENNNIQYSTGNGVSAEEEYFRNLEEYSNMLVNSNNNYNNNYLASNNYNNLNINQSLIFRHSKTVYIKNQNNIYNNLLDSNLTNKASNNLNYSLLVRNSMFTGTLNTNNFNSSNNLSNILSSKNPQIQKPEENQINLGLRMESAEKNCSGSFSSTNCSFGRMSNPIFSANYGNNRFGDSFNSIELDRKPSLDCLPFMRSNSQTYSDFNVFNNFGSNAGSKSGLRSKKDEMKKWLSRI